VTKLEKLWGDPGKSARDLAKNQRSQELLSSNLVVSLKGSTRVLVRPIGLDMVEVASSNLAGPTKHKTLAHRAGVLCLDRGYPDGSNWRSGSTNSDHRRNLDARVKRRRPEGVTTREAIALCSIRLVLTNTTDPALCRIFLYLAQC